MQFALKIDEVRNFSEASKVNSAQSIQPYKTQLLKWVGNKQRFAHEIISFFPSRFGTYHEPFLGSGAVLAVLAPNKAIASDVFKPLAQFWQTMRSDPETVKNWYRERWGFMQDGEKKEQYEAIKARFNAGHNPADLLFLCRSAYGGVVRFRKNDGYMSTPCGVHNPIHPGTFSRRVDEWSQRIKGTEFHHQDYTEAFARAKEGDVIYCDPPYTHSQAILYGAQSFSQDDLFNSIEKAKRRGIFVALSLDGSKKSGKENCPYDFPEGLFERQVGVNCGRSMLKRFQMEGRTLENENVTDRLLLTH